MSVAGIDIVFTMVYEWWVDERRDAMIIRRAAVNVTRAPNLHKLLHFAERERIIAWYFQLC